MPRRHRQGKQRSRELPGDQEWELILGPQTRYHGNACKAPAHPRLPDGVVALRPVGANLPSKEGVPPDLDEPCSWFTSPAEREEAWWLHRDRLLAFEPPGDRPWAYFEYELREHPPWPPGPMPVLASRGLLSDEEEAMILTLGVPEPDYERVWGHPKPNRYAAAAVIIRERRGIPEEALR